ncbi:MAG: caspase family protein [Aristaeellaceae bacterium]
MRHTLTTGNNRGHRAWHRVCCAAAIVGLLLCPWRTDAETLSIPAGTLRIEDGAFAQCREITCAIVPEGVTDIGAEAFRGCAGLREITLPASVSALGEDMLAECTDSLWIHCPPDSAALRWAKANGFDYDADTVYRALIIGQSYTGTIYALTGPANDARSMRLGLGAMGRSSWIVTPKSNLTSAGIVEAIASVFAQATENDVSLIYYSGHGLQDGSLVGSDLAGVTPAALRAALDSIPGRKIVIVDACYSGKLIDTGAVMTLSEGDAADFNSQFIAAFTSRGRGELNAEGYYVISAAGPQELSYEDSIASDGASRVMGIFTYCLCRGFGWNGVTDQACALLADANGDGAVSMVEAAVYASAEAQQLSPDQTAQYWPADATWFAPFRP